MSESLTVFDKSHQNKRISTTFTHSQHNSTMNIDMPQDGEPELSLEAYQFKPRLTHAVKFDTAPLNISVKSQAKRKVSIVVESLGSATAESKDKTPGRSPMKSGSRSQSNLHKREKSKQINDNKYSFVVKKKIHNNKIFNIKTKVNFNKIMKETKSYNTLDK